MTQLAQVMRSEIQRLARKEVKAQTAPLKKALTEQKRAVASLKRENAELRRLVNSTSKKTIKSAKVQSAATQSTQTLEGRRYSAKSLRSQRRRTGLSQADYATLLGVSTLTVSNWELEKTRPRQAQLEKIVSLRGLGRKEALRMLEELGG